MMLQNQSPNTLKLLRLTSSQGSEQVESEYAKTVRQNEIGKDKAARYQALAAVPDAESAFSYAHVNRFMRVARELSGNLSPVIDLGLGVIVLNQLLKKDGKLFVDWCNSGECSIGNYDYARSLMKIAREFNDENR